MTKRIFATKKKSLQLILPYQKDGQLVKCPFRGPHSFSYSKGDSGQVCKYPESFMDTCSDNKRLQLRYQACLDVEGSEIASKLTYYIINIFVVKSQITEGSFYWAC